MHLVKTKIDGFLKLYPPKTEKKYKTLLGF